MGTCIVNAYCQFSQQACTNFMQTYLYLLISTHFFILPTNLHWGIMSRCFRQLFQAIFWAIFGGFVWWLFWRFLWQFIYDLMAIRGDVCGDFIVIFLRFLGRGVTASKLKSNFSPSLSISKMREKNYYILQWA